MATPTTKLPAFAVSKKGLAKLLARKGKAFAVVELIQNSWDEDSKHVHVTLEPLGKGLWKLVVEDDNPEGFKDLTHAYTLFAESLKKSDATQRGRFNLGEKLVIAICESARISTTKGAIIFEGEHRRHTRTKREQGSVFEGILRLTQTEAEEVARVVNSLLPPHNIETTYNLNEIPARTPVRVFEVALRTEIGDDEGRLKPTIRKTKVEVYEPLHGEQPNIYELGIPVVATDDRWHVNVMQKVPLNTDRDNVPPAYLRDVRVAVLNACHDLLSDGESKASWVTNAMEDENADPEAVKAIVRLRFGEKVVAFDPNDQEANARAAAEGYTVVPGGALPKAAWKSVKGAGAIKPAGQVTPSPSALINQADGGDVKFMDPDHWPSYITNVVEFAKALSVRVTGATLDVKVANDATYPVNATYAKITGTTGELTFNLGRLGHKWFEHVGDHTLDILLDEFGHHFASSHLDERYYRALRTLGAKMTILALEEPEFFESYGFVVAKEFAGA